MMGGRGAGGRVGLVVFLAGASALAAPTAGRVRLSLEGGIVAYENVSVGSVSASQTTGGVLSPSLGVGVAGGIGDNVVLGGRFGFTTSSGGGNDGTSQTQVSVMAIPEYVADGDAIRPFLAAGIGYSKNDLSIGGKLTSSTGAALLGGGVGAHCFAADAFSIDPSVSAYYERGTVSASGQDGDVSGYVLLVGVAFSGWLGHAAKPEENSGTEPAAATWTSESAAAQSNVTGEAASEPRTVVKLAGGSRATFRIDPREDDSVEMVVIVAKDLPAFAQCAQLVARTSKGDVTFSSFKYGKVGGGFDPVVTLSTKARLEDVAALASGEGVVTLEGCGEAWSIQPDETEDLRELVAKARAHQRRRRPPTAAPPGDAGGTRTAPAGDAVEATPAARAPAE